MDPARSGGGGGGGSSSFLGPGLEDSSCLAPLNQTSTLIALPPLAAGFEDSSCTAPLNRTTPISHHRQFEEMLLE
jgi:hypothetical protein